MKKPINCGAVKVSLLMGVLLCGLQLSSIAQVIVTNVTEGFEDEFVVSAPNGSTKTTFSQSGVNFTLSNKLRVTKNGNFGANNSSTYLESNGAVANEQNLGPITITTAQTSFKINSFAIWTSSNGGITQATGNVTFIGTLTTGGTAQETINVAPTNSIPINGVIFTGALANQQLVSLSISLANNLNYVELDDINFSTAAIVTNQFSINDVNITEGNAGTKTLNFAVSRNISSGTASVNFATANGTATTANNDYVAGSGTVNFLNGESIKNVGVTINGDLNNEVNETFTVNLNTPSVGYSILDATGIGTILDDDNITETYEDEVSNATSFSQNTFQYSTSGSIRVVNRNGLGSGGSNYFLSTPSAGPFVAGNVGAYQLTNPGMAFNIKSIDVWTAFASGTSPNFTYTPSAGTITFTGNKADGTGVVTHTVSVSPVGNAFVTVNFTGTPLAGILLTSLNFTIAGGSPAINFLQIDNFNYNINYLNDTQVYVNDITILEGTGEGTPTIATFTVSRTNNTSNFTVNIATSDGTATAGSDYTAIPTTTLTFTNGGSLTQTVSVSILKDALTESSETFNLNLSGATNGTVILDNIGVCTIYDDEQICETFEDEADFTTTFSQSLVNFSTTSDWRNRKVTSFGSGSSNGFLSSGTSAGTGNVGKIIIANANMAFKIQQLDAWTSVTLPNYATGQVTFTGTLFGGGTVSITKTIAPTSNGGTGYQTATFTGTALDNVLLTELDVTLLGSLTYIDIDNFCYAVFSPAPIIEITDASNNLITNNGAASTVNGTDFGGVCLTGESITKTFTIKNTGNSNLTLSGSPLAILGGTGATHFTIMSQPTTPVVAGGSTTVTVKFDPSATGTFNATLTLTSNDVSNNPFIINLRGNTHPTTQDITTNITPTAGNVVIVATQTITANNDVLSGANATYRAGNSVTLNNGFLAENGSTFKVEIKACN